MNNKHKVECDKMSVTKSHSGILVNVKYIINKVYTFTN